MSACQYKGRQVIKVVIDIIWAASGDNTPRSGIQLLVHVEMRSIGDGVYIGIINVRIVEPSVYA